MEREEDLKRNCEGEGRSKRMKEREGERERRNEALIRFVTLTR